MILKIEAIDTLFFRDGKPFEMGDENWANGIFPPLPSVFYGAIRSAYFSQYPEKLHLANTDDDPTKILKIRGLYLYKDAVFVPVPAEFVTKKNHDEIYFQRNNLEDEQNVYSSAEINLKPYLDEVKGLQSFLPMGMFSSLNDFISDKQNTNNATYSKSYLTSDKLITKELKVGIGRQNTTRTTEEGKLYRVALNRMEVKGNPNKKLSFLLDINLDDLEETFNPIFLKIGGENKIAKCEIYQDEITFSQPTIQKYFKLAFLTPAIFNKTENGRKEGGWLPDCFVYDKEQKAYIGTWKNVKLKLLSAFINGSVAIGGFDVKLKQPKKMNVAIPAGSVYHFEILDSTNSKTIYSTFANPNESLSDILHEQGLGLSIVGLLNN